MASVESSQTNWQITKNTLKDRNKHMFNNTLISDVNFSAVKDSNSDRQQSLVIPAHKYILAISSSVFYAMFYGHIPDTSDTIELPDCDSDSFMELLRFLYYDEVKLTGNNVIQVLYLAKKYMIPSLSDECTKYLQQNLDANNVFSILPEAQIYEEASLVDKCWKMVDENSEEAMSSEAFLDTSHELLKAVLARDSLNASEVDICKAVDRWAEHQCEKTQRQVTGEEKRKILGDAVNLIRFPLMTEQDFAATVPNTNLLPKEDMCDILLYFNNVIKTPLLFSDIPRQGKNCAVQRIKRFKTPVNSPPWNYTSESVNSVAFSVDHDISVLGVRLFGSQGGKYSVTIGIYGQNTAVKLTEEVDKFDTDKDKTDDYYGFDVLFKTPAAVKKTETYEIRAVIKGPVSYHGTNGQTQVTDGKISFSFSASSTSPNGTKVTKGQFPEILFF